MSAFATFPAEAIRAIQGALGRALAGPSGKDGGYVLKVAGDRPVRIELTGTNIGVISKNDVLLLRGRRTVENAEAIADLLSSQRLVLEAEALRKESRKWKW